MDAAVSVRHNLSAMLKTLLLTICFIFSFLSILFSSYISAAPTPAETEVKKTYLEDIFIWRMSDELKLSAQEEKQFTEIQKDLNKKKSDLNKKIQEITQELSQSAVEQSKKTVVQLEATLKTYRSLLAQYNQISVSEFDLVKKLLGAKKFAEYVYIKSELNNKVKSLLVGDKDKKETAPTSPLPAPKVIIERSEPNK